MDSDPLTFLPVSRWHTLNEVIKLDWPGTIPGHILLDTQEYIIKKGLDYGFQVYCPFRDVSNGIVAINTKNTEREIIIQYPKDDTSVPEKALRNTKVIDWSHTFEICWTQKFVVECVKKVMAEKGIEEVHTIPLKTFVLKKQTPFDVKLPPGVSFEPLTTNHDLELINSVWPHRYPSSVWYFELLTKSNLGFGLFENKQLVSWVFVREIGAIGQMYTIENKRRKRYGEITVKLISNMLMSQGKPVFAYSVHSNKKVHESLKKLGFGQVNDIENCTFRKQ